ncbi:unnamed protein product [Arctogadus glacialis]
MATSDSTGTFQWLVPKPPLPVQSVVSGSWFHRSRRLSVLCQGPLVVTVGEIPRSPFPLKHPFMASFVITVALVTLYPEETDVAPRHLDEANAVMALPLSYPSSSLWLQTSHEGERVTPLLLARGTTGGPGAWAGGLARFPN